MFKEKKSTGFKFVYMGLFAIIFIFGGLFTNISKTYAAGNVRTIYASYTLSDVISTPNSEGGITTKVMIGCAPLSNDVYDINTGKPCVSYTTTKVLVGCAVGSGDLYDINTGKPCISAKPVVITGCKAQSGDIYDITTGKLCTNNTKIANSVSIKEKPLATMGKPESKVTQMTYNGEETTESILAQDIKNSKVINDDDIPGREKIKGNILATAGKVGSILTGPMSFWVFLLIIIIVIGGGYGIYNIIKKDDKEEIVIKQVEKVASTPIANPIQATIGGIIKEEVKTNTTHQNTQTNVGGTTPNNQTVK